MKSKLLCALFLILLFTHALPADTKRMLSVDDMYAIREVSDAQVSPDGKWVAYVVSSMNKDKDKSSSDLYMVPATGGDPIRLTSNEGDDGTPKWSPDNRYLAYLSERDDVEQLYLLDRNGGEPTALTKGEQDVLDFSWSPDSQKIAFVMSDKDPDKVSKKKEKEDEEAVPKPIVITRLQFKFDEYGYLKELYDHIYVMSLADRQVKQITSGPYNDAGEPWQDGYSTPQWSPDGKQILFAANRSANPDSNRNTDIFVVPAEGGEPKKLTDNPGTDAFPQWSPDGKWIVYESSVRPQLMWYDMTEVDVIPATGGAPRPLTRSLDRNTTKPLFSADGKTVYFLLEDQGKSLLASVNVADGKIDRNRGGEGGVYSFHIGPAGQIAFIASRHTLPAEVFTLANGKAQQLTFTNAQALENIQFGATEYIKYPSKDGTEVAAFVTYPPQHEAGKKLPLILDIHGGPTSQYDESFDFQAQLYAANGYVVLRPNPRGSTGYGTDFCKAIWADWGNKDYDDVMAGVDFLVKNGVADEERLGVGGWSYGGILTDVVITKTTRFKAAVSGASMLDHFLGYGIDHYQYEWETEIGLPWEKPEAYLKLSPYFRIQNVKTPTLVAGGQSDQNVPLVNSEQLYQALRRLGVETMLIVYPDQPHSISRPSYIKDFHERCLAWYGKHLTAK